MFRSILFFLTAFSIISCTPKSNMIMGGEVDLKPFNIMEPIRISYGADSLQFGDLMMPYTTGRKPVIMIIHGGCWRSKYDYTLMNDMAKDLAERGYATWNIEYRRTEDVGGGWPNTITDVAQALKHLVTMAQDYPLDLDNVMVTGHSAGGHLALMLGAQSQLKSYSKLKVNGLPKIKGIVSLAGITDLETYLAPEGCGDNVPKLVEGNPDQYPDRYKEGSPITYLPLGIPQKLITGINDDIVSIDHITPYYGKAGEVGDPLELITVPDAGHFEVIQPGSVAWKAIVGAFEDLVEGK